MLTTALAVVDSIRKESKMSSWQVLRAGAAAQRDLDFHNSMLSCLLQRSKALEARLQNEMNLAFHTNAQHDSLVSSSIAEASKRDSNATKAISILGMVFLPGTFVSAIFSMSFFHHAPSSDGGSEEWRLSSEFWMYWAVAIPLTVATIVVWYLWQREPVPVKSAEFNRSTRGSIRMSPLSPDSAKDVRRLV
ncbi:hypothetical protein MBLNU230_g8126t1 [Neophaeotheca triangularis]